MKNKLIPITLLAIFLIGIVSAVTIESVTTTPSNVAPGSEVVIRLELENNLDEDVENVEVSLNLQNIPFSPKTSSDVSVDEISEGDSEKVSFTLIADSGAEAETYKIPLTITYKIGNQTKTKTSFISAIVNAKPVLTLTSESQLIQGQNNEFQIQITNKGLARAKFLDITLGSGNYELLSSREVYIGDLNSNDFDSASFDIHVNGAGTISVPVTVSYQDSANNPYTESQVLILKVYSQKEAQDLGLIQKSNTLLYIGILVVIVLAWIIYRRIRKRKMRK